MSQEYMTFELLSKIQGAKDDGSNINVTFNTIFRAETLKFIKFSPKMFLIQIIIYTFATAN